MSSYKEKCRCDAEFETDNYSHLLEWRKGHDYHPEESKYLKEGSESNIELIGFQPNGMYQEDWEDKL